VGAEFSAKRASFNYAVDSSAGHRGASFLWMVRGVNGVGRAVEKKRDCEKLFSCKVIDVRV
jgi:hypothetical protein